ncbi:SBBP repeat-containing protein [Sorangium sp. So ce131]|uniref:SBBP repeat-containing protein n=1 Tax=Sorangium sp. So ce131 TaxID=3133282 RepID=UPI003F608276
MQRSGLLFWGSALAVVCALGGCFDKGVILPGVVSGAGGGGSDGGNDGGGGAGGSATTSASSGVEPPCEPCYFGPPGTKDVGACKGGCLRDGDCDGDVRPAAESCETEAIDETCDGGAPLCIGELVESTELGDGGDEEGHDVTFDGKGNVLVAGGFTGRMGTAGSMGATDAFFLRRPLDGTTEPMIKVFGASGTDHGRLVASRPDGTVIIAGTFQNNVSFDGNQLNSVGGSTDIFVAKLDSDGNLLWLGHIGGMGVDAVHGLSVDRDGGVFIAGTIVNRVTIFDETLGAGGGEDIFVAKISPDGRLLWSRAYGDTSTQRAQDVAATPDGGAVVVGSFSGTVNFGRGSRLSSSQDAFMVKLDAEGNTSWDRVYGDTLDQEFTAVAAGDDGKIYVAGGAAGTIGLGGEPLSSADDTDVVVAAFGADATTLWRDMYPGEGPQKALGVAVDGAGNVLVTGQFRGDITIGGTRLVAAGGEDAFLVKLKPSGKSAWVKHFGGTMDQIPEAVAVDALGNIALTGTFAGTMTFGQDVLMTSVGGRGAFLITLQP